MDGATRSWISKKKAAVAPSTCEADYYATVLAVKEHLSINWLAEEVV